MPPFAHAVSGFVHSVERFAVFDGPGLRYAVFFQGCPLRCLYCHNPDARAFGAGRKSSAEAIIHDIVQYRNFLRRGGVTLTGGEPLAQPEFALELIRLCHDAGFHTALDTSGCIPPELAGPVLRAADLVMLDIKALSPDLCRTVSGADGCTALANLEFCESLGKPVWIRHVLVPGLTLDMTLLRELAIFLRRFSCIRKTELLPYHTMGDFKRKKLGLPDCLHGTPEPSSADIEQAKAVFDDAFSCAV